jgi:hypothetical protein
MVIEQNTDQIEMMLYRLGSGEPFEWQINLWNQSSNLLQGKWWNLEQHD